MKSRWSKILSPQVQDGAIQAFQMHEFKTSQGEEEELPDHDCSALQQEAFERGRNEGKVEGRAECQAQVGAEVQRLMKLANQIGQVRMGSLEEHQRDIVEVALAIARKILLKELAVDKNVLLRQVRQALCLVDKRELVTIRVHPTDARLLCPVRDELSEEIGGQGKVCIASQEDLEPGSCIVEQAGLLFDSQISSQLQMIREEFGLEEIGDVAHTGRVHSGTT